MEKKEGLMALIKSLSKSEKRYFKLFISKNAIGESSHYLKLFDFIEKAGTTDKQALQKYYGNDDFIQKQYGIYKHLLYKQILKSLRAYHSEKSVDARIMELISDTKILFDMVLYSDAGKMLKKAKGIASKYEKNIQILEIIYWEKKIILSSSMSENTNKKKLIQLFEEEKSIIKKIDNLNEYWKLKALSFLFYLENGALRRQEDIDMYNIFINAPILKNPELALSYWAKISYYGVLAQHSFAVNNIEESYVYSKKIVDLIETHPHQIEYDPMYYCSILYNLLLLLNALKKYDELFYRIPKLKFLFIKFQFHSPILLKTHVLEFGIYIAIGQFKVAMQLLPEVEALLKEKTTKDEIQKLHFYFGTAQLYFGIRDYNKALVSLNIILNDNKNHFLPDIYSIARILYLIIHFEKENTDFLPYLVKSIYRYLLQKKKLYKVENVLIQFLKRTNIIRNTKDQIEAFKVLREELINVMDHDPMEARFLEAFDIISWLDSKIENRPFGDILREKSGYVLQEGGKLD